MTKIAKLGNYFGTGIFFPQQKSSPVWEEALKKPHSIWRRHNFSQKLTGLRGGRLRMKSRITSWASSFTLCGIARGTCEDSTLQRDHHLPWQHAHSNHCHHHHHNCKWRLRGYHRHLPRQHGHINMTTESMSSSSSTHLVQLVPPTADIIHQNLVGSELIFNRRPGITRIFMSLIIINHAPSELIFNRSPGITRIY